MLLLDEPTNHLDLPAVLWLQSFLQQSAAPAPTGRQRDAHHPSTVVIVSHDHCFLTEVATDVIVMQDQALKYYPCGIREWKEASAETMAWHAKMLQAAVRQEKAALEASGAMRQQAVRGKGVNSSLLKQARQKEQKAAQRIGLYREDGKAFKMHSLPTMDLESARLPDKIQAAAPGRDANIEFPPPHAALRCSGQDALLALMEASVPGVLGGVRAEVTRRTRAAVVGANGAGKTTCLRLLAGELQPPAGLVRRLSGVSVGFLRQQHAEALPLEVSACDYLAAKFRVVEFEARKRLGKCGLRGGQALQPLGQLSGGQRALVSLCECTWDSPHVLLLDEPTNHLDQAGVESLAAAVRAFKGGAVVVSHNLAFLAACCQDLWVLHDGELTVFQSDERTSFSALFSDYAALVSGGGSVTSALNAGQGKGKAGAGATLRAAVRKGGQELGRAGTVAGRQVSQQGAFSFENLLVAARHRKA